MAARWRSIVALPEGGRLAHHDKRIYAAKERCDFRLWLQADIQPPEIDFRFAPKSGHSEAYVGLPLLTPSGLCNKSARSDANRCLREQPVATQGAEQVFISCLVWVGAPVSLSHQEVGINGFALREQGLCLVHRVEVRNRDRAAK